jgi:hypothetical protein
MASDPKVESTFGIDPMFPFLADASLGANRWFASVKTVSTFPRNALAFEHAAQVAHTLNHRGFRRLQSPENSSRFIRDIRSVNAIVL